MEINLLNASTYRQLTPEIVALSAREQTVLNELTQRFKTRLAVLQRPDAAQKVTALFESKGKLSPRPKTGASF